MKMRRATRRRRHFTPAMYHDPANEPTRALIVTKVASQRAEKEPDILIKRVERVPQRLARGEKVTTNFALNLEKKTGFRFVVGVIGSKKISKQLSIFVDGINRVAEKSGIAAE